MEATVQEPQAQIAVDAGRVSGAWPAGLFRDRAGLHGGLWHPRLSDRPILNQISKAYGENNAILDNCHVRVAFSSNDERTAKRISDALGTATELRAQRNYAGHRLAPWLGHVMVSKQETARALLTPGEVMQLPPQDELVLVSSLPPIRAKKLKYYEDANFIRRVMPVPDLGEWRPLSRLSAAPSQRLGQPGSRTPSRLVGR